MKYDVRMGVHLRSKQMAENGRKARQNKNARNIRFDFDNEEDLPQKAVRN